MNVFVQQVVISGVGGQGVLFVTKLLGRTALRMGYAVMISETHGMAQRGGNVISHLKVGRRDEATGKPSFASPLIRPGCADVLLGLHPDGVAAHGHFLREGGRLFGNAPRPQGASRVDASGVALRLGAPVAANLVLLGFGAASGGLFCQCEDLEEALEELGGERLETSLKALSAGCGEAAKGAGKD